MKKNNSLEGKTILLVNTGTSKKKFIIQRLKKLGLNIVVLHKEKNWAKDYVKDWIIADTYNHTESLSRVREYIENHPKRKIDGVITFWEDDILLTSKIVDRFNFIGIPYDIARQCRNKYLFRQFCEKNGIKAPRHRIVHTKKDLIKVAKDFKFPLVIKPAFGSSSAYVVKVHNMEELAETFNYVKKNISTDSESALTDGFEIFVEEYLDGDEVDIDILMQNGKAKFHSISDNYNKSHNQFFVDSGQAIPSSLPAENQEELLDLAEETLEKFGIQNGCIHFEAKSTPKGAYPIELNLRMGGDYVYSYTKSAWNIDLIENSVKIATGEFIKIKQKETPDKYLIGWDLHPDQSGMLVELDIDEELKNKKCLEDLNLYKEIGDPILIPPEGYERIGWLTVSGENPLDAQDNLKDVLKHINFRVTKFDNESSLGKTSRLNSLSAAVFNKNLLLSAAKFAKVRRIDKKDQRNLHIGIVGNAVDYSVSNTFKTESIGQAMVKTLRNRGYQVTFFDFNNLTKAFNELKHSDIDLAINICDRLNNSEKAQAEAAAILESLQIPYVGSDYFTLALCQDKIKVKKLLSYHNTPTPAWDYAYELDEEINPDLKYPLIVKPGNADSAIGITNDSVVKNKKELKRQLKKIIGELGMPALVEEYIEGDEYDVSILGTEIEDIKVLPLARSSFKKLPKDYWHIYTYDAKHQKNHPIYKKIRVERPAKNLSKKLEALVTEIAIDAYAILDCRDYGRVEIRVDSDGNPYVLELNPNTSIGNIDFLPQAAKLMGLEYADFLEEIINLAITRYKSQKTPVPFANGHAKKNNVLRQTAKIKNISPEAIAVQQ
ncbi:MAG: ATP-grasp domain-containing protein [Patescibacteria group bacterium]|jgi:D-alanine-D-alanine ligase